MFVDLDAVLTNKTPSGTYRAPGRYEGSSFCDRLIEPGEDFSGRREGDWLRHRHKLA